MPLYGVSWWIPRFQVVIRSVPHVSISATVIDKFDIKR